MVLSSFSRWAAASSSRSVTSEVLRQFSSTPTAANFDKLGVIGLGLMGHGIAQTAAIAAVETNTHSSIIAYDSDTSFLDRGRDSIQASVDKLISTQKLSPSDAESVMDKISFTTDRDALHDTDLIVEDLIENTDLKKSLYSELGAQCKPETIFASNTSSLSITEMAVASNRPEKFVGIHFFNPAQLMKLVELIHNDDTDPAVFDKCMAWVKDMNTVGECRHQPGFIVWNGVMLV